MGVPWVRLAAKPWASETWTPLSWLASWACSPSATATVTPMADIQPSANTVATAAIPRFTAQICPNDSMMLIDVLLCERSGLLQATVLLRGQPATEEFLTFTSGTVLLPDCSVRKSSVGHRAVALEDGRILAEDVGGSGLRCDVRVLVVEDEAKVARALQEGLEGEHYEVVVAKTGEEGFFRANAEVFDLVILDLMLPRRDGLEVLGTLRNRGIQTPVLILTARDTTDDRVHGLDCGADDYLVKPFAFPELLARIRALLRRGRMDQVLKLQHDDIEMDLVTRRVTRGTQLLDLTAKEFEILEYLLRHPGRVVSREMLARDVWQVTARATPLDNVIDVTIARLRRKLDDPFDTKLLHTVRGVGFVLGSDHR